MLFRCCAYSIHCCHRHNHDDRKMGACALGYQRRSQSRLLSPSSCCTVFCAHVALRDRLLPWRHRLSANITGLRSLFWCTTWAGRVSLLCLLCPKHLVRHQLQPSVGALPRVRKHHNHSTASGPSYTQRIIRSRCFGLHNHCRKASAAMVPLVLVPSRSFTAVCWSFVHKRY